MGQKSQSDYVALAFCCALGIVESAIFEMYARMVMCGALDEE